ncbi:hypothetical protein ACHAWF_015341 [Thalassiosira exigua]
MASEMASTTRKRGLSDAALNVVNNASLTSDVAAAEKPAKKPRKKPVTAKSLGLTKEEYDRIRPAPIKKALKSIVKSLANQVDADWHDGYEEQAETKGEWFEALQEPLQAVLDIGVGKRTALQQCNEVLKIVADSWCDLLACPCRGDTREDMGEMDKEFDLELPWADTDKTIRIGSHPEDMWSYVWNALLRTHASMEGADEATLLRCIKDASDNNGYEVEFDGPLYDPGELYAGDTPKDEPGVPDAKALSLLVKNKASEWQSLSTTKKVHRMRGAIDRRFDGTPERRTRDYHLYDDSDDEYGY